MSHIERLPAEVLRQILTYLDSVLAFAFSSKQCFAMASPLLYASLHIRYSTPEVLREDIERWTSRLKTTNTFQYVRSLSLTMAESENHGVPEPPWPSDENLAGRWLHIPRDKLAVMDPKEDQEWQPLASFIHLLPELVELHYSCWSQLAPCVLATIESRAGLMLSLGTFALRSLLRPSKQPVSLDSYELKLATSPNLRSIISTRFRNQDNSKEITYLEQAVMSLASGLAPNLEAISLCYDTKKESAMAVGPTNMLHPDPPSIGLDSALRIRTRGSLRYLELKGQLLCEPDRLRTWTEVTDFSKLTTLKIRGVIGADTLRWLVADVDLTCLQSLVLYLHPTGIYSINESNRETLTVELSGLLVELVKRMPSLRSLRVNGMINYSNLGDLVSTHGSTLQQLAVFPSSKRSLEGFDFIDIDHVRWKFAALRELTLPMKRTGGDLRESQWYRWLGSNFPKLQKLFLVVDCCWEEESQISAGHLHSSFSDDYEFEESWHMMRNYAIDADLVKAIFRMISASKPCRTPVLEQIELRILEEVPWDFDGDILSVCQGVLGSHWVCRLEPHAEQSARLVTNKISAPSFHGWASFSPDIEPRTRAVFDMLWPEQPHNNWWENWQSFPLTSEAAISKD